jgi:hypothetical protein
MLSPLFLVFFPSCHEPVPAEAGEQEKTRGPGHAPSRTGTTVQLFPPNGQTGKTPLFGMAAGILK